MKPSPDCFELLKRLEGFRAVPYLCGGERWTVGYGSTVYPDGSAVAEGDGPVSREMAEAMMRGHVDRDWQAVGRMVKVPLSQGQCDALLLLAYNIGLGAFGESTLLKKLNAGDYAGAGAEFARWNKAGGAVNAGLVRRRRLERRLFEKG